ncbi:MAG: CHAP domain-containing protein [Nitrospiria bacterium]
MGAPCATTLASYKGVPARSNQGYPYGSCDGTSVYGLRYQCVEYVRRFYHVVKGIETRENAWRRSHADTFFRTADEKGLKAFENGGPAPPLPDDILTFQGGMYGHVAVITAVTDEYIEFIEQNLSRSGTGRLAYNAVTHRVADRDVPGGKLISEGWLRPHSE